ncbi:hypothetical protein G3I60_15895 [Streptomyces sp. SID13666]|uniref:hypothetical protein n=1 Tax=Streptomyces sp. SID13666 TaxID=2706054 RepID=UPI0013C27925|nr:hypothetical protein [Streptomyces sp. SID13666]NEA55591.1 hypothetical protein [Streptomyces sp. SID13666]
MSAAVLAPAVPASAETVDPGADQFTVVQDLGGGATAKLTITLDPLPTGTPAPGKGGGVIDTPDGSTPDISSELAGLDLAEVSAAPGPVTDLNSDELGLLSADNVSEGAEASSSPNDTTGPVTSGATTNGTGIVAPQSQDPGSGGGGRAVLMCYNNRSFATTNGVFYARHNCTFSNINWGYKISPKVQAIITSTVHETGLRWWKNGKSQPANSNHFVGKSYYFHGTMGPVKSWDGIDFQDYMSFSINIGGRPGFGTLVFAGGLLPLRG